MHKFVYYREYPIDVEIGVFKELSKKSEIVVVSHNQYEEDRKQNNWGNKLKTIIVDKENVLDECIKKYEEYIHLFSGVTGKNGKVIRKCIKNNKNFKFFIIAERPDIYGNIFEKAFRIITRKVYYSLFAQIYKKHILGFLAMGKGVQIYENYGFKNVFPYMYTLELHDDTDAPNRTKNDVIKLLYIGRFCDKTKGLDILRKAFDKIPNEWNLVLDMVGGYGVDASVNIEWAKTKENVNFLGSWKSNEVFEKMQNYDICIVPSRYDGWNLSPNQAIDAGIGVIISDNATSDELVKNAENGIVFKNESFESLYEALKYVNFNKEQVKKYKENSKRFKKNISNEKICDYFLEIIDSCTDKNKKEKPHAPWINDKS